MMILYDSLARGNRAITAIYAIINLVNDKAYIGSAVNLCVRISTHRRKLSRGTHENKRLQNAWNKYGEKNFKFVVLEFVNSKSKEDIIAREQHYIDNYRSADRNIGYNICLIADRRTSVPVAEDVKKRISEKLKGRIKTPEEIEKMRRTKTGVPWSDKLREARTKSNWMISGENAPKAKLTEIQVKEIRRRYKEGNISYKKLAKEYGVGKTTIQSIIERRNWKHLEDQDE